MPNIADGLREDIEYRMKNPTPHKFYRTFEDEHNRMLAGEERYKERKRAKARKRYHDRKLQKRTLAEKENILKVVKWICHAKTQPNYVYNEHVDNTCDKFHSIKNSHNLSNSNLYILCMKGLDECNAIQSIIRIKDNGSSPFAYTAAILNNTVLPKVERQLENNLTSI